MLKIEKGALDGGGLNEWQWQQKGDNHAGVTNFSRENRHFSILKVPHKLLKPTRKIGGGFVW